MSVTPQKVPSTGKSWSGLDRSIQKIREEFIKRSSSGRQPDSENSGKITRLLEIFYTPGYSPSGLIAQVRQRILVVESASAKAAGLVAGDAVQVVLAGGPPAGNDLTGTRIVRISEYPNDDSEFGQPTQTVLIAWKTGPKFLQDSVVSLKKGDSTIQIIAQGNQADNFIISGRDSPSPPDPPIASLSPGVLSQDAAKADYSDEVYKIIKEFPDGDPANRNSSKGTIRVVVSDTGLKLNLNRPPNQHYQTNDGRTTRFPIAVNPNSNTPVADANRLGFCSLTNYLDDNYLSPPANQASVFPPNGIPANDSKVLSNPNDDNHGRHGTCITGIITHNPIGGSKVIPLKIFDFLGYGTLFDILCGFNYVFSRLAAGENIRIVNASWVARVPDGTDITGEDSVYILLEKKIAALKSKNVFVIAAAGNREKPQDTIGRDISVDKMVPACYSSTYSNVITVTTVAEKWKKQFLGFLNRSRYVTNELEARLFKTDNLLERFINLFFTLVPDGYVAVENYSSEFVQAGVVAHPIGGVFPMPFGGPTQPPLEGSSFATAFMSAYVVDYLTKNPGATRDDILGSLKTHPSLYPYIQQGRYLELDTVTGRSIEENFEPVIRALLSTT